MIERELLIQNKLGLHARAAAKFVQCASQFESEVRVRKDGLEVNGKSIMGVLLLAAPKGSRIEVFVEGPDEEETVAALEALVDRRFDEE